MMRLLIAGAMLAIAMPAASGQYMKLGDVKGESKDPRCAAGNGEAIQGGLDRDIIRRIPSRPKPQPGRVQGGVQVAAGDVTGGGQSAAKPKAGDITLKRGC